VSLPLEYYVAAVGLPRELVLERHWILAYYLTMALIHRLECAIGLLRRHRLRSIRRRRTL
jgi:hypothetical protein